MDICLGVLLKKVWEGTDKICGWVLQNVGKFAKAGDIEKGLLILEFELNFSSSSLVAQEFGVHTFYINVSLAFRLLYPVFVGLASLVVGRVIFRFRHNKLV